jgi:dTDP-4-amino-4,6-dideoxygalactose transaminase
MLSYQPMLRLEIAPADLLAGLLGCVLPGRSPPLPRWWSGADDAVVSLTLRSGFDLYLAALALPPGSEILISAVTHPDLVAIARTHGLVPIPVDVEPATMAMQPSCLRRALGPRSRIVMVTHLFGGRLDLQAIAGVCQAHGLLLIEDGAQIFGGGYPGHPAAAACFFSFGPIKTATALGGAVTRVRDAAVRARMQAIQAGYPRQSRRTFAGRVVKYAGLWALLRSGPLTDLASWLAGRRGLRISDLIRGLLRNVTGEFKVENLRLQPSWPLLRLLHRRLRQHTPERVRRRQLAGQELRRRLDGMELPGSHGLDHLHWIFPAVVADPQKASHRLLQDGFHTQTGLSNLNAFDPPEDRPDLVPHEAWRLCRHSLLLPLHGGMSAATIERLCEVVATVDFPTGQGAGVGS